jgi:hypothetical protein
MLNGLLGYFARCIIFSSGRSYQFSETIYFFNPLKLQIKKPAAHQPAFSIICFSLPGHPWQTIPGD